MRPKTKVLAVKFWRIWKFSSCKVYNNCSGHTFTIYACKNEEVCCAVQMHFGNFPFARFAKKFWAHFQDLCVQKQRCLRWSSHIFSKFSAFKVYRKSSGHISWFVSKNEAFCYEVQMQFRHFWLARFIKKKLWCIFTIYVSKNKAVSCEVQMHFGSSPLVRFTEKVLGAFSRFICPKTKMFAVKFRRIF